MTTTQERSAETTAGPAAASSAAGSGAGWDAAGWAVPGVGLPDGPAPAAPAAPAADPEPEPAAGDLASELADLTGAGGAGAGGPGDGGGHPVLVAVVACLEALETTRAAGLGTLRPVELRLLLLAVAQIIAAAFALRLRLLVAGEVARVQDLTGATSVAAFLAHLTQTARPEASAQVRLAKDLDRRFPLVADALARGLMSPEQVRVAVAALRRLPAKEMTPQRWEAVQGCLVQAAQSMNPTQLRAVGRRLWEVIDPDGAERRLGKELEDEEELARATAYVRFWRTGDGTTGFRGRLPDLQADMLLKAIQAFASPRRTNNPNIPTGQPDDHRHRAPDTRPDSDTHDGRPAGTDAGTDAGAMGTGGGVEQASMSGPDRGADGDTDDADGAHGADGADEPEPPDAAPEGATPPQGGDPPPWRPPGAEHSEGRDEDGWTPEERDRGREIPYPVRLGHGLMDLVERLPKDILPTTGAIAATIVVTMTLDQLRTGLGACALDTGTEVSAAQVRRLACEAGIIPAVLGGESEPLDVGRERRFHTKAQRIAIHLRDRGCPIEGCDRPSAWTHAHHTTAWADGGHTNLADGISPCAYHHRLLHSTKWTATRLPNGKIRLRRTTRS